MPLEDCALVRKGRVRGSQVRGGGRWSSST